MGPMELPEPEEADGDGGALQVGDDARVRGVWTLSTFHLKGLGTLNSLP